jgi:phenylalanyl-tRNA synthetase alpha chain
MADIHISRDEENRLLKSLESRTDSEAVRFRRYVSMPDLSRTEGNPLKEIVDRAKKTKSLAGFDVINIPEIVPTDILFDLFNMPEGHPARSKSDTYYVDEKNVLRTHDTVFWYYYLNDPIIKQRIVNKETLGALCYGKVYRKDEIDSRHMNVFHQFGGLLLAPDEGDKKITPEDLKAALSEIARSIFGDTVEFRFYDHNFPYTDPSFEMEAFINGQWIEILGCGMARKSVLKDCGIEGYHGWAFGFGLERLAIASMSLPDIRLLWSTDERVTKQFQLGRTYQEVSKYPPTLRDISFIVDKDVALNNYYEIVREFAGNLIEEVKHLDTFENEAKFGPGKVSHTFRIIYRSPERTLTNDEVNEIQDKIREKTASELGAVLR